MRKEISFFLVEFVSCGVVYLLQLSACLPSFGAKSSSWSIRPKKRSPEVVFATVSLEFNWTSGQDSLLLIISLVR